MDEFEQAAAELRQNGSAVVFDNLASESATPHTVVSRRDFSRPSLHVRDLGIQIDCDLVMCSHVQKTLACFAVLRQLRQIHHSVPPSTLQTLVVSLVLNKLDFSNAVLLFFGECRRSHSSLFYWSYTEIF